MIDLNQKIKSKIEKYINPNEISCLELKTTNIFNLQNTKIKFNLFINLESTNNIRRINKFHEAVNSVFPFEGIYVSCAETLEERRARIKGKVPFGFKNIIRIIDFFYKRVIPKLPIFKKIYFFLTRGHNRVLSKAEILGRLISCGFDILEYFEYENLLYVISKKTTNPKYDMNPSYGPLFRMKRVGYKGKIINVYKFRTMYPYSEYLQSLITKENSLAKDGKIANDYRVTNWGRVFRRFWIDEIPMIINLFKGELNIIGVRPLSIDYFSKYPKELKELRIKYKPGLLPPYYADMPKNFDEILLSEKKYIIKKLKNPLKTDIKYFCKAFNNIIFKGARSR